MIPGTPGLPTGVGWPAPHGYDTQRQWLQVLAEREILRLRARYELSLDELRGLYVSDRQVDALLRERGARLVDAQGEPAPQDPLQSLAAEAKQWRDHFSRATPLEALARAWPLSSLQQDLVLLAFAPDLDLRFETLWAYLNNDIGRRHLTLDLAARLLELGGARERAELGAALQALTEGGLLERIEAGEGRSRLVAGWRVAPEVLRYLSGELQAADTVSAAASCARCGGACAVPVQWTWPAGATSPKPGGLVLLNADPGQHAAWAHEHAAALQRPLLWALLEAWPEPGTLRALALQARLAAAVLGIEPPCSAAETGTQAGERRAALARVLRDGVPVVLALPRGVPAPEDVAGLPHETVRLPRVRGAAPLQDVPALARIATRVRREHDWPQLVLAPMTLALLREVAAAIAQRDTVHDDWGLAERSGRGRGIAVLFSGPSGTGKTMAACVLARASGRPLYRVDLAGVVSKYIGETEKNLDRVFTAARGADAVLLFDEADALLGKRSEVKDAHDRYANLEVAYLLQRLEEHDGVVILASNLARNIDTAFARRLHYIVEFPRPGPELRERIWRGILAPPVATAADLDLSSLAAGYELTGGEIQNLVLEAAFAAAARGEPIAQATLLRVLQRQQTRQGRSMRWGARLDPAVPGTTD